MGKNVFNKVKNEQEVVLEKRSPKVRKEKLKNISRKRKQSK